MNSTLVLQFFSVEATSRISHIVLSSIFLTHFRVKGMSPFFRTRMIGKTLTRVTAGTRVGVSGASLSPTEDSVLIFEISKYRHDRSCLEMSEADGVDGGAFRKRGLTHLQWAEKPEAPEAERHLGTRILE
ncbi:hypothetical protein V1478_015824 [Vespula squamosa]|uniref:Uncharacterized protein n=1 Tax=Vespula squamosa TaxID=30214 RepID=A0ABD2A1Z9_VESSQ